MPSNVPQIRVVSASDAPTTRRVGRRPQHAFNVKAKPFEIAPFMLAPVLAGETMKNLLLQSRVVSDPIKNPLIGWHQEYYFFYVKMRGMTRYDPAPTGVGLGTYFQQMMLDPTGNLTPWAAAANSVPFYTAKGTISFLQAAYEEIVAEYFRDEDEANNVASIENYYAAMIDQQNWAHSMKLESATGDDAEVPGVDQLEELDILPGFTTAYDQWEIMRDAGMTDLTYEDYLRSQGVNVPKSEDRGDNPDESFKPELVRYVRKWSYPTNHVDPATGAPSSALSWSIAERADKDRFFKEPGFLIGVTVTRPKIYLGSQKGTASGLLSTTYRWLPRVLDGHPYTSVVEELDSATDGILQNQVEDYWLDMRDLFVHGEQFVNHAMDAAANHGIALPTASLNKKYPSEAMVDSLFVTAGSEYVRQDGVVHLNILSRIRDTTPGQ